jgi:hypothetical protein
MSFGQQSGPPASAKQMQYLLALLKKAGYEGFREARGPLGFTQRQGSGKFTTPEASALIDQLLAAEGDRDDGGESAAAAAKAAPTVAPSVPPTLPSPSSSRLANFTADALAQELERRGWTVVPPG